MIGDHILSYLKPSPPRHTPKLNLFLGFLRRKLEDGIHRASYLTPNGHGTRILVDILKIALYNGLLQEFNPSIQIKDILLPILPELEQFISQKGGRITAPHLFIRSRQNCYETIIPVRRGNPLTALPLDKDYADPQWGAIKPFRMVDMGPCDLRFAFHMDYLQFPRRGPTHAVYSLDCLTLCVKFAAYCKSLPEIVDLDQVILDYLRLEVVPSLMSDHVSLWLRSVYRQQLITQSPLESLTTTMWDSIQLDTLGAEFTGAMREVYQLRDDLSKYSLTPRTVLSSFPADVYGTNVIDFYKSQISETFVPASQPQVYVETLRQLGWWEFFLITSSYTPDLPETLSLFRFIQRDLNLCLMVKPWQDIHNSLPYRQMVRTRLEGLSDYMRTYR